VSKGKEKLEMVGKVSMRIRSRQTWAMVIASGRRLLAMGVLLALMGGLAGSALAQNYETISWLQQNGAYESTQYTTTGVITAVLSKPGAVNGIGGTGSSVVYTNAYYVQDATGGIDMYGALPHGDAYTPTVGDVISVTGQYAPFHDFPEMATFTAVSKVGTASVPAPSVLTIPYILSDYNNGSGDILGSNPPNTTILPNDLSGMMITLNNVKISGAGTPGTLFGTANSPSPGAFATDSSGNQIGFYYWPTSYSTANQNLANVPIPSGYVDMTGFLSLYGNSQVPEFTPTSLTLSPGPPLYWQPAVGANNWDGVTTSFSTTSGSRVNPTADASSSAATFDDTGLLISGGSTVNVGGGATGVAATSIVVSNSAGTYNFTGTGSVTATQFIKNGAGTLLLNTTVIAPVSITAGTMAGAGTIYGSLTVGGTSGPTVVTPGATPSTIGTLTIDNNVNSNSLANFSAGGTYLWKMGPSLLDSSNGVAGTNWDVLSLGFTGGNPVNSNGPGGYGGYINFSGSSQLAISFANTGEIPGNGNSFWNTNHTWVIAGSCNNTAANFAPEVGGSILNNGLYSSAGTFTLAGDPAYDLVLKWTSAQAAPRNLLWSNGSSTQLVDATGTWSNSGNAKWAYSGSAGLTFDSTRPDNATFGNPSGSGGAKTVSVSGAVTAGSITFNGGNAAIYDINGTGSGGSGGTLAIDNGITANQTATLGPIKAVILGYSQTWSVASGTLSVNASTGITQDTLSSLTVTGPGELGLYCSGKYGGGTILANNAMVADLSSGGYALPQSGVVTMAAGTQFLANGNNETVGALSGAGTINLGSGAASAVFTFGDASNQTFSGLITGNGSGGQLIYQGGGVATLSGVNNFSGSVSINGASGDGELVLVANSGLGNSSNPVIVDNGNMLGASASFSSSRSITIGPNGGVLDVIGSNTVLTLTGPLTSQGVLTVNNSAGAAGTAGMLVLTNSNNSFDPSAGSVTLSAGTLSVNSPACLGTAPITFLGEHDGSTLLFAGAGTYANNMSIPVIGQKAIYLNTQGNNVTLTGLLSPAGNETLFNTVDIHKTGSGSLTFACSQPGAGNMGNLYVDQGGVVLSTSAYASNFPNDSPFGGSSGGFINVSAGASLQLANAQLGVNADVALNGVTLATISLYSGSGAASSVPGASLLGSGSSTYENGAVEVNLNYSGTAVTNNLGNLSNYGTGSVTIGSPSSGGVFQIGSAIHQYDAGSNAVSGVGNYGGNAIKTGPATYADDANKLVTIHVTGPGVVQLQSGGVTSNATFGGDWSVDSGVLEVGPYQVSTYQVWDGPYGQLFNALGFKTLDGQTTGSAGTLAVNGDPDMPNGVTVNHGGMFVVAADQVNYTWDSTYAINTLAGSSEYGVNGTPNYFRNPITLTGGTLAVSGNEVIMSLNPSNYGGLPIVAGTTAVTGLFGGNFIVSAGTSTIATYDVLGSTGTRTVQLLGGSRVLSNSTAAYAAGTTISYSTNWSANSVLNVDGGTAGGGEFDLLRDAGGLVTVGSNAKINIINGATVRVGDTSAYGDAYSATQNSDPGGALYDPVSGNSVNFTGTNGHLVFSRTADITYRGNISGGIDLTQNGTGTLVLTGSSTYTGGTYVPTGTVEVEASSAIPDNGNVYVGNVGEFGTVIEADGSTPAGTSVAVPEPGSLALLLAAAGFGIVVARRCRGRGNCPCLEGY
jgi:fibronectin-binding autotransporter adhesin